VGGALGAVDDDFVLREQGLEAIPESWHGLALRNSARSSHRQIIAAMGGKFKFTVIHYAARVKGWNWGGGWGFMRNAKGNGRVYSAAKSSGLPPGVSGGGYGNSAEELSYAAISK
jgi:hypothetical protein